MAEASKSPEEATVGHEDHNTVWATAGAPGIGHSLWCDDCKVTLWSDIRVMEA